MWFPCSTGVFFLILHRNQKQINMKKLIFSLLCSVCAVCASADVQFEHLDNIDGTNVTLVDKDASQTYSVTDAVFINNGKEYKADFISCHTENGVANIKIKFNGCSFFKDCKVVLTVNGEKETVSIKLR